LVYVVQFVFGLVLLYILVKRAGFDPRVAALVVVFCNVPVTYLLSRFILNPEPAGSLREEL
jgi:hypothetical protein